MQKNRKKKQLSGGAKLKKAGKRPVLLGLLPEQHEAIRRAALLDHRTMAGYITHAALQQAARQFWEEPISTGKEQPT